MLRKGSARPKFLFRGKFSNSFKSNKNAAAAVAAAAASAAAARVPYLLLQGLPTSASRAAVSQTDKPASSLGARSHRRVEN